MQAVIQGGVPKGTVQAPPSKSVAHRLLICAALCRGESVLRGVSFSQDIQATVRALQAFGAVIEQQGENILRVRGFGMPNAPAQPIDCGESGSTLRFCIALAALTGQPVTLTGHGRLMQRPQTVYQQLFDAHKIVFSHTDSAVTVCGRLCAGEYTVAGNVSSQFITGLLLALSCVPGQSSVTVTPPFESAAYVALTVQAMRTFGVSVQQVGNVYVVNGVQDYQPQQCEIEGDWSQAAFFGVLGSITGTLAVCGLRGDSMQGDRVVLDILRRCGAQVLPQSTGYCFVPKPLRAVQIDLADCPDLGPVLMVLALFCEGKTHFCHARRLRMKESDRIAAMESEIRKMGGMIQSDEDNVWVTGGALHSAVLEGHNDHRIVMAMAVAAAAAGVPVTIQGAQAVQKSYGSFWEDMKKLGIEVRLCETT